MTTLIVQTRQELVFMNGFTGSSRVIRVVRSLPAIFRQSLTYVRERPRFIRPQYEYKVFCIGFNKTGTTSLHSLFGRLGYRSYHGVKWRKTKNNSLYHKYDCFCDGIPDDFTALDQMFPGSRFILQVRELDRWLVSRLEHIRREKRKVRIKGHSGWLDGSDENIIDWVHQWNEHHLRVLKYFRNREDDLLIINYVRDPLAVSRICRFLGHPDVEEKLHRNKNRSVVTVTAAEKRVYSVLASLSIPAFEYGNDLLCPSLLSDQIDKALPNDTSQLHIMG
jgi:hypothetical protein